MIFSKETSVKSTKFVLFCTVGFLLIFALSACKGKNTQKEVNANNIAATSEAGAYPLTTAEGILLEPSDEELIYPGLEGESISAESQDLESYPSISDDNDSAYPDVSEELNPYPGSDTDGNLSYPDPAINETDDPETLPGQEQASATPTLTLEPLLTTEPSPTATPGVTATPTPTMTPTPSPTAVPTATSLPLIVDRSLEASNPKLLKLASGKVQLIEFFAFWDATSKAMAPLMNQLNTEYGKNVYFHFLDIDDPATQNLKKQLGYRRQPHLFLIDAKGNILKEWTGFVDEAELRDELTRALQR